MADLTGTTPSQNYKDLLQVSNANAGIDTTARSVEDGEATASLLQLSASVVNINGAAALQIQGVAITATAAELSSHSLEFVTSFAVAATATLTVMDGAGMSAGYDYDMQLEAIKPATDGQVLRARLSLDGGSTFKATASSYAWRMDMASTAEGDNADTEIQLNGSSLGFGNDANNVSFLRVTFTNPGGTDERSTLNWMGFFMDGAATPLIEPVRGNAVYIGGTDAIDALELTWHGGGNFTAQGDVTVYRRRRS